MPPSSRKRGRRCRPSRSICCRRSGAASDTEQVLYRLRDAGIVSKVDYQIPPGTSETSRAGESRHTCNSPPPARRPKSVPTASRRTS
jgi:hypothetical protein